jgi:hypothetical protein
MRYCSFREFGKLHWSLRSQQWSLIGWRGLGWSDHGGRDSSEIAGGAGLGSLAIIGVQAFARVRGVQESKAEGFDSLIGEGMSMGMGTGLGARSCWPTLGVCAGTVRACSRVPAEVEHVEVYFCPYPSIFLVALTCKSCQGSLVRSLPCVKSYLFYVSPKCRYA